MRVKYAFILNQELWLQSKLALNILNKHNKRSKMRKFGFMISYTTLVEIKLNAI